MRKNGDFQALSPATREEYFHEQANPHASEKQTPVSISSFGIRWSQTLAWDEPGITSAKLRAALERENLRLYQILNV